jgi:hypothetical protein
MKLFDDGTYLQGYTIDVNLKIMGPLDGIVQSILFNECITKRT